MNYYRALQRETDGRWDFTCTNDGRSWPTGYCAGWKEWTEDEEKLIPGIKAHYEKLEPLRDKYHQNGHATKEEAVDCYRRYELDTTLDLDGKSSSAHKCLICSVWTDRFASVSHGSAFFLCDDHRTREEVEKRYVGSSEIASS